MKRILTAAILLLWAGCFFHCSAEQLGMLECTFANCDSPCPEDDCGDEDDRNGDAPCGLCDFVLTGGSSTVSPLDGDDLPPEGSAIDLGWLDLLNAQADRASPASGEWDWCACTALPRRLCELLGRNSVPLRGPTA